MIDIRTAIVQPGTPEVAIIARWRAAAFSVLGADAERERRSLEIFVADQRDRVALIALKGDSPIGTCLLVPSEIDPVHAVSPWLAGLYVVPERRRRGAGAILVCAIEAEARQRGAQRLHLYTRTAVGFYERLGWIVTERRLWLGAETALMTRELV